MLKRRWQIFAPWAVIASAGFLGVGGGLEAGPRRLFGRGVAPGRPETRHGRPGARLATAGGSARRFRQEPSAPPAS